MTSCPFAGNPFAAPIRGLSRRATALLENRATASDSRRAPSDTTGPLLMAALRDLIPPWPQAAPLHRTLRPADTLLLTSLFPDNRIGYLEKLASAPGRRVAIFHDAIPMRDPNVRAWERDLHVRGLKLLARMDLIIAVSGAARSDLLLLMADHAIDYSQDRGDPVAGAVRIGSPRFCTSARGEECAFCFTSQAGEKSQRAVRRVRIALGGGPRILPDT